MLSEGLRPSDSATRSLARRVAGALRFRLRYSYGGRAEAPAARRRARGSLAVARSGCWYLFTEPVWVYEIVSNRITCYERLAAPVGRSFANMRSYFARITSHR
jgi:hypothetical protein